MAIFYYKTLVLYNVTNHILHKCVHTCMVDLRFIQVSEDQLFNTW